MITTFPAHGEFTIRAHGHAIRVDALGPWNLECTFDYVHKLRTYMQNALGPFCVLMISHHQPILGLDGEEVLRVSVRERVRLGCAAQATVLLDPLTIEVARAQYKRVYEPEGLNHEIFQATAPATQWLLDKGFPDISELCRDLA